jgi:hypothetical protein
MPTLGSLAAGLQSVHNVRRSEVYITELDDDDRPLSGRDGAPPYRRFQYFPDSITDSKAVNWEPKEVPGGSLPLYHYTGSGERNLSFTVYFTTDIDHLAGQEETDSNVTTSVQSGSALVINSALREGATTRRQGLATRLSTLQQRLRQAGAEDRNPYIPGALSWLRRFMLPRYGENTSVGVPLTKPPHKLLLHFPGSDIERLGGAGGFSVQGGGILCVMTQCDITFESFFPSGNPRIASVSLAFAEVPQRGGYVRFPSATELDGLVSDDYWLQPRGVQQVSAHRGTNTAREYSIF